MAVAVGRGTTVLAARRQPTAQGQARLGRCRPGCALSAAFDLLLLLLIWPSQPDAATRDLLVSVCGTDFADGPVCCTGPQVESLKANLDQAEPLLSSCPACRNNFRALFCTFTCSGDQAQFLDVSATQKTLGGEDGNIAVKSVEYYVADRFRTAFYDSCKDVKFGASNGFAMDLIGGGAKEPDAFLKFLGDEKPLVGSPFQINFPHAPSAPISGSSGGSSAIGGQEQVAWHSADALRKGNTTKGPPLPPNTPPRACYDDSLLSRCACTDCPAVCAVLPPLAAPVHGDTCRIGRLSCFSFVAMLLYLLAVLGLFVGYSATRGVRARRQKRLGIRHRHSGISVASESSGFERVRLDSDELDGAPGRRTASDSSGPSSLSAASAHRGLVGATGLGHGEAEDESSSSLGARAPRSTGLGLGGLGAFDALGTTQPRSYALNVALTRAFYKIGLVCARAPFLTFAAAAVFVGLSNIGWRRFEVETDPVRLWVAPASASRARKEYFDEHFGPFYRTQQIFMMDASGADRANLHQHDEKSLESANPALNWDRLQWWADVEAAVRDVRSESGLTLQDVCFSPSGPGGPCVTQSILGYFQDDLDGSDVTADNWRKRLDGCASSPAECLPTFQQPLKPNIILGGIPAVVREPVPGGDRIRERKGRASDARAVVSTFVVNNSLDAQERARAMEWERALEGLLFSVAGVNDAPLHPLGERRKALGIELALSTESSLQQELGSSSNTDIGVVIASYLLMFLYAALTLGGSPSGGVARGISRDARAARARSAAAAPNGASHRTGLAGRVLSFLPSRSGAASGLRGLNLGGRLARRVFVESKFTLGLFGILVVLASVSSAVGLFSAAGVKVTLIIGEVLPFLLLAVGVDNIFILSNEMDRQNALASTLNPYASASIGRGTADAVAAAARDGPGIAWDDVASDDSDADIYGGHAGPMHGGGTPPAAYHIPSAERAARALSRMGPSILLSATTQVTAFLLGAVVPMPAVRNFALYAAGSMAIAAVLQCTVFVAAMALDADRTEAGRVDCAPCVRLPGSRHGAADYASLGGAALGAFSSEGSIGRFIRRHYAPWLIKPAAKRAVLVAFAGLAVLGMIGSRHLEMGLDQRLALPPASYLRSYFNALDTYLDVGPPVYFVARHVDAAQRAGQQALCGRFTTCKPLSLANTLEGERGRPEVSFLAEPASSWLDDFFGWTNPVLESCCRVRRRDPTQFCTPRDSDMACKPCFEDREPPWNITLSGMPEGAEFERYLRQWLQSPTDSDCPLGGQAAYSSALSLAPQAAAETSLQAPQAGAAETNGVVIASHFRTYHTPLRSQADFIDALGAVERIAADINAQNADSGLEVFAYR